MVLTNILEKNAKEHGNRTALVMKMGYRTVSLSYGDVYEWSKRVAVFLERQGLQREDKVLLLAPNSPYWICLWWGSILGGYVPVPLNIQSTSELVRKIAEQTGAKVVFKYLHYKQPLPSNLSVFDAEFLNEIVSKSEGANFRKPPIKEKDVAELMYTSGTTGDPKGVILTHKNISSNLEAILKIAPIAETDKFLSILPLSHIFEQVIGFLLPYAKGAPIVYAHSPAAIRDLLREHRITTMAAVPEFLRVVMMKIEAQAQEGGKKKMLEILMKISGAMKLKLLQRILMRPILKKFGGRFHTVISGGAPLDPELEKKWNALGVYLLQGYGLTETSPVVSSNSYEDQRVGSVGKILPGVEVKIAPDGEILVKGANIFQGYFQNKEKTKEVFIADGPSTALGASWFKTGDIGELDKEGFLYLKGRKKYMIKGPGAQNVYPEDIELELNKIPEVKDSCVVGVEKSGGQVEIHAVLLGDIKDPEKIITRVNKKLSSYQNIAGWSIWPREDFPRSATRKVKKEEVLRWLKASKIPTPPTLVGTPLTRLLSEITGHDVSGISQKTKIVSELNLDSLLRVELVSRIEEGLGITVDEAKISSETTVLDLEEMIKKSPDGRSPVGRQEPTQKAPPFKNWPLTRRASLGRMLTQILIIFPLARIFAKLKIEGKDRLENLPLPAIFMPNHVSFLDSLFLLMALPLKIRRKIAFAAAEDVLYEQYKNIAWLVELFFNAFPFPRHEHENIKAGLEYMGRLLDKNWSIAVYPEGKMSMTRELLPLKRGAGLVGVEMDSYIVPVKISGTADIMPAGKIMPRKGGQVSVKFGKPIKFKKSDSYIEVTRKLEGVLKEL
ncbi:MAG: AMP-binding protein [Candidatus Liptonbacteria bacterium]|nr:AMP-binding protein [Candidatus Liptonbacteria bacterium]